MEVVRNCMPPVVIRMAEGVSIQLSAGGARQVKRNRYPDDSCSSIILAFINCFRKSQSEMSQGERVLVERGRD